MVISWIHACLSDTIRKSVLFVNTARETWIQLEKRFSMTNGSRKYKLNKDLYNLKQNGSSINVYFTSMSSLWEEIDDMSSLPVVTESNAEIKSLLNAKSKYQEEQKLFQFLNGLDEQFGAMRSQLLMLTPLPTVDCACSMLQQEESQREVLLSSHIDHDVSAMYSRNTGHSGNPRNSANTRPQNFVTGDLRSATCSVCGIRGHTPDRCWKVVGYPSWHHKSKTIAVQHRPQDSKWGKSSPKLADVAQTSGLLGAPSSGNVILTQQQFDQLLR
uniref:Retrotransposon gag domain-containing protein n=1 Tax=Chenopodium quinoa TaxID=63459 RepID=A0A803MZA9_CHEQI